VGAPQADFVVRVRTEKGIPFEGYELNPSAVKAASLHNVELYLDTVESLAKAYPGKYAAVCSFQVLEHLTGPASFLKAAIALLRPAGRLILGMPPNMESFLRHQFNLLDMPPHSAKNSGPVPTSADTLGLRAPNGLSRVSIRGCLCWIAYAPRTTVCYPLFDLFTICRIDSQIEGTETSSRTNPLCLLCSNIKVPYEIT
jgi:hypothetical protein